MHIMKRNPIDETDNNISLIEGFISSTVSKNSKETIKKRIIVNKSIPLSLGWIKLIIVIKCIL